MVERSTKNTELIKRYLNKYIGRSVFTGTSNLVIRSESTFEYGVITSKYV